MKKILIVKPSSLGDIVHVFPALELLRRNWPDCQADWLVHPAFADLLDYSPLPVHRRILFERKKLGKLKSFLPEFCRLLRELRREKYDLVIDFQGLLRSGILAFLARRSGPVAGFAAPRESGARFFYGRKFAVPGEIHAVERNTALVNALLGTSDPVPETYLGRPAAAVPYPAIPGKKIIGMIPGARWESKQFPERVFAGVMMEIRKRLPGKVIFRIIGSANERDAQSRIMELAGDEGDIQPLAGETSMAGMVEALRPCNAVFCNDSGPMHVAAALQIPVTALFGPTRPDWTGPYGKENTVLCCKELDCLGCMERICPKFDSPRCHRIRPEVIAGQLIRSLQP